MKLGLVEVKKVLMNVYRLAFLSTLPAMKNVQFFHICGLSHFILTLIRSLARI